MVMSNACVNVEEYELECQEGTLVEFVEIAPQGYVAVLDGGLWMFIPAATKNVVDIRFGMQRAITIGSGNAAASVVESVAFALRKFKLDQDRLTRTDFKAFKVVGYPKGAHRVSEKGLYRISNVYLPTVYVYGEGEPIWPPQHNFCADKAFERSHGKKRQASEPPSPTTDGAGGDEK